MFAGSEPPVDLMARDLIEAQPDDATTRTYYRVNDRGPTPGGGTLATICGRYYLAVYTGTPTTPAEMLGSFWRGDVWEKFKRWPRYSVALETFVPADVSRNPQLRRIVVWDSLRKNALEMEDRLGEKLGPGWKREENRIFHAHDHWTWRKLYQVRRRVYERVETPPAPSSATKPASNPTTRR